MPFTKMEKKKKVKVKVWEAALRIKFYFGHTKFGMNVDEMSSKQ